MWPADIPEITWWEALMKFELPPHSQQAKKKKEPMLEKSQDYFEK